MSSCVTVGENKAARVGILDHTGDSLGGGQLVVGHIASTLSERYEVEIIHPGTGYTRERLAHAFGLDLSRVRERTMQELPESFNLPGPRPFFRQLLGNGPALSKPYDLFIYSGHGVPPICYARRGLVYCHFPMESSPEKEVGADSRWARRHRVDRWIREGAYRRVWRRRMVGYCKILANSCFTASWIQRRWGRPAEVLYPPVGIQIPAADKCNLIVSVGRFTAGRRSKNQLEQVAAFRDFLTQVSRDWRLCFCGVCGENQEDQAYLREVQAAAEGLPVVFQLNEDREVLVRFLAEAKLFWHTAGLAVDEAENPQQAEHFGIATVEAMRAGCVPIVIAAGGQREIIEDGRSGFLSKDLQELTQRSVTLAQRDTLFRAVSEQARQRSLAFVAIVFDDRIRSIASECLAP